MLYKAKVICAGYKLKYVLRLYKLSGMVAGGWNDADRFWDLILINLFGVLAVQRRLQP